MKMGVIAAVVLAGLVTAFSAAGDPATQPQPKALKIVLAEGAGPGDSVAVEMIGVPPGEFMMGTKPGDTFANKGEFYHKVRITRPFYLGKYELTLQQWCAVTGKRLGERDGNLPASAISWIEAKEFTAMLNERLAKQLPEGMVFRLPTEAEWEYAARAGATTRYYWGDDPNKGGDANAMNDYAWHRGNTKTCMPVGLKRPNAWGFYDVTGNVWELCLDYLKPDHTAADEVSVDPLNLTPSESKVAAAVRGGSFIGQDGPESLRLAAQWWNIWPDKHRLNVGVRLAIGYPMPAQEPNAPRQDK